MAVYVDGMISWTHGVGHRWSHWCHMRADTLEELHAMADAIGHKREWFQDRPGAPHYDLNPDHRELAIAQGAIVLTRREWVAKFPLPRRF